jgi:hypothetical protein
MIHAMIDRSMDGLVLVAPVSPRAHLDQVAGTVPTVVVGRHRRSRAYDTVADDDFAGAALVVGHLADLGHRRIAHIEHHESDPELLAEMPNAVRDTGYRLPARHAGPRPGRPDRDRFDHVHAGGRPPRRPAAARAPGAADRHLRRGGHRRDGRPGRGRRGRRRRRPAGPPARTPRRGAGDTAAPVRVTGAALDHAAAIAFSHIRV